MTKELIENIRTIVVPYMAHDLSRINYENMGKLDAEQFTEDMIEILDLATKALEQEKEKAMQEIDDPLIAKREPDAGPSDDDKRLERIALTTNHFRAYQYGEPYEGKPVAMSHGFDIVNADAEIILLGLDILKDLQELDTSLDAAVNYKIREKRTNEIIHKLKEGIKL